MKEHLRLYDGIKLILSILLIFWIYITSFGWAITTFVTIVCMNDLANGIANRMRNEREKILYQTIESMLKRGR